MSTIPLAEVKAHLRIAGTDHDVRLQAFLDAAETRLGSKVGPLSPTAVTERVQPVGGRLLLSYTPLVSVTSITPVGSLTPDAGTPITSPEGLVMNGITSSYTYNLGYTVVYQAGWTTLPADIRLAVKELVRHLWASQGGGGTAGRRPGSGASDAPANTLPGAGHALPFRVSELIADYEQMGVA